VPNNKRKKLTSDDAEYKEVETESIKLEDLMNINSIALRKPKRLLKRKINEDDQNFYELYECHTGDENCRKKVKIFVSLECMLLMNIHAHLMKCEIIGLLSGTFERCKDTGETTLYIFDAHPCRSLTKDNEDALKNVELHPDSAVEILKKLDKSGERLVGWYHSHPTYEVHPSSIDIENHFNYQKLFENEGSPFVGFILAPFSKSVVEENCICKINCFYLIKGKPFSLSINPMPASRIGDECLTRIESIHKALKGCKHSTPFNNKWRKNLTYNQKLLVCVQCLLKDNLKMSKEKKSPELKKASGLMQKHKVYTVEGDKEQRKLKSGYRMQRPDDVFEVVDRIKDILSLS